MVWENMVFKRRDKRGVGQHVWDAFFPRKGWRRAIEYIGHRVKRLPDTPHKISLGFACGVFVSFSPLFGLHFLYAAICAFILRGNVLAALLGTFFGNPLTFPFIATVSYRLGRALLGQTADEAAILGLREALVSGLHGVWHSLLSLVGLSGPRWDEVREFIDHVFTPYFVGGLGPGIASGLVCYILARPIVAAYQKRRRAKRRDRKRRKATLKARPDPAE